MTRTFAKTIVENIDDIYLMLSRTPSATARLDKLFPFLQAFANGKKIAYGDSPPMENVAFDSNASKYRIVGEKVRIRINGRSLILDVDKATASGALEPEISKED